MSSSWQLVIKDLQGHQINVEVSDPQTATVLDVKRLITQQDGNMPVFEQRLVYNREEMNDEALISSYPDIKSGSQIHLIRLIPFQLFMKGINGSNYTFRIPSKTPESFLVSQFKKLVQERTSLRPDEQRLLYAGKQLVDSQTLGDYNIPNNATLHLVSRLRGGAWSSSSAMPCGHSVPYGGLYQHCMTAVRNGSDRVLCPSCSTEWSMKILRGRSELSESQIQTVDDGLTKNFCLHMPGVVTCKGCGSVWSCSTTGGGELCSSCAAKQHDANKATVELLRSCPTKTINHASDCPTLRACPNCGNVIEHECDCRRVDCSHCKTTFCFVCLRIRLPSCTEYYPCQGYTSSNSRYCYTAQRQQVIS